MKNSKQVIVIRKDLNMSAGKLAAQVSHASMAPVVNRLKRSADNPGGTMIVEYSTGMLHSRNDEALDDWLKGSFTKVVVYVKSEVALLNVYKKAQDAGLPCELILDAGRTEFNEPTHTCVGIGPCWEEDFEGVTSKLRLFDGEVIPR